MPSQMKPSETARESVSGSPNAITAIRADSVGARYWNSPSSDSGRLRAARANQSSGIAVKAPESTSRILVCASPPTK